MPSVLKTAKSIYSYSLVNVRSVTVSFVQDNKVILEWNGNYLTYMLELLFLRKKWHLR